MATTHALSCAAAILAASVAVMGQLYNSERRWPLIDPDAVLVIAIVVAGIAAVYAQTASL